MMFLRRPKWIQERTWTQILFAKAINAKTLMTQVSYSLSPAYNAYYLA